MNRSILAILAITFASACLEQGVDDEDEYYGYEVGEYPGLGEIGEDWDGDEVDDATQNIIGPVPEFPGDVFIRGPAFSDPYAWSNGMFLICTNGQVWDTHYWAFTGVAAPADMFYVATLDSWMPRGTWACTFTDGGYQPLIMLETWHDMVYTSDEFCAAVTSNTETGLPVLAVESNSGTCAERSDDLYYLLRALRS